MAKKQKKELFSPAPPYPCMPNPISAQLSVCDGCCCGHPEKGNLPIDRADFARRLSQAGLSNVVIDFPYCLGPCHEANVVRLQAGRSFYLFRHIRTAQDRQAIVEFIQNPAQLPPALSGKLIKAVRNLE